MWVRALFAVLPLLVLFATAAGDVTAQELTVSPPVVRLAGPESSQQLLVTVRRPDGLRVDATRAANYSVDANIARLSHRGLAVPTGEGATEIVVEVDVAAVTALEELGETTDSARLVTVRVPVDVTGLTSPEPVSFRYEVIPSLTKAGCNAGGCHGKAEGKGGLKLSVFGFDPRADHEALAKDSRGRRVRPAAPETSLFVLKGTAAVPHGGGLKIDKQRDALRYARLLRWVREGAAFSALGEAAVESIEISPPEQVLYAGGSQQIQVIAVGTDGARRCVTVETEYESNAAMIATVDERGLVEAGNVPGEATILVRYMGHVAVCRITHPRPGVTIERPAEVNFVDRLVWNKLERLGIQPSGPATDTEFLRRTYLDTIGTLPTSAEVREFLADTDTAKRSKVIDTLLERPEYADYWAMKWADILRVDRRGATPAGAVAMTRWLRKQMATNRPYDEFVSEILTSEGNMLAEGPGTFYRISSKPDVLARSMSQLFLGVRIECAECHQHPSERWGQDDYYALAGYFTGLKRKSLPGGGEALMSDGGTDLNHPRTGEAVAARPLGAPPSDFTAIRDRRTKLVDWMLKPNNPFFAKIIVNRLWAHYFGRGLVEPIDDLRATNPPTNEPLMEALAQHLRDVDYDVRAFTRTLLNSRVYQISGAANETNATDEQNFSRAYQKVLPAEVLLDAIAQVTGIGEKFDGWPAGFRSIQVWDSRMPSYFFRIFGRPLRVSVCECERSNEPSISQALHLLNSPELLEKLQARDGNCYRLATSERSPAQIIDEVFLTALARFPSDSERAAMLVAFDSFEDQTAGRDRRQATEDVVWAVINSKGFIYNH